MKVLGICCTPRVRGNTEVLLQESLATAEEAGAEVELVTMARKNIISCDGCNTCSKTQKCHIEDDLLDIYPKLLEADGMILGTPLYFSYISTQAKAVIDRTYALYFGAQLKDKVGGVVITAEGRKGEGAIAEFSSFVRIHKMVMAGHALGSSGHEGYKNKKAILKDENAVAEARALGKAVVEHIHSPKTSS